LLDEKSTNNNELKGTIKMPIPQAVGTAPWSGKWTATQYAAECVMRFYASTCMTDIFNTRYEGKIKAQGDKIVIPKKPTVVVRDYTKNAPLEIQTIEPDSIEMDIDSAKYFAFGVDSIDEKQQFFSASKEAQDDGVNKMRVEIEKDIFGDIYADANAANQGATAGNASGNLNLGTTGSPLALTTSNIIDNLFLTVGQVLDEQDVPDQDRFIVIPTALRPITLNATGLNAVYQTGDKASPVRTGMIGMIDKLKVYVSNNLASSGTGASKYYHVIAGNKSCLTWAMQLTEAKAFDKGAMGFGGCFKSLSVYGKKVTNPEGLVHVIAKRG